MKSAEAPDVIVAETAIHASAARVFAALTDPRQRAQWWNVQGKFEVTEMTSDLRPGGAWQMRGVRMGNLPFAIAGVYRTVDPPRVLEMTWQPDWDGEPATVVRFDLTETSGVTTIRVTHSGFVAGKSYISYQGWPWLLGLLRAQVEKQPVE